MRETTLTRPEQRLLARLKAAGSGVVPRHTGTRRAPDYAAAERLVKLGLAQWARTREDRGYRRVQALGARVRPDAELLRGLPGLSDSRLVVRGTEEFAAAERLVADGLCEWAADFPADDPLRDTHRRVRLRSPVRDRELEEEYRRGYQAAMDELAGWLRECRPKGDE